MTTATQPQERGNLFKASPKAEAGAKQEYFNFPVCVTSYNTNATPPSLNGVRMDTGEEVVVALRPANEVKGINQGEFSRPEIKDFAMPRKFQNSPGVTPGGAVMVTDAYQGTDGTFHSRWINVLSHTEDEAEVLMCTAHYDGVKKSQDASKPAPYGRVTILFDGQSDILSPEMLDALGWTDPFTVSTVADARNELIKLLDKDLSGGLRLKFVNGDQVEFDSVYVNKGNAQGTVEEIVDAFLIEKLPDGLDEILASDPGNMLEIIPFRTVFMGKKSAQDTYKRLQEEQERASTGGTKGKTLYKIGRYNRETTNDNGKKYTGSVFGWTLLALRLSPANDKGQRALYFTHVEPLFKPADSVIGLRDAISYAATANFAPAFPTTAPEAQNDAPGVDGEPPQDDAPQDDLPVEGQIQEQAPAPAPAPAPARTPARAAAPAPAPAPAPAAAPASAPAARRTFAGTRPRS